MEGNNADCSKAPLISSNSWGGASNSFWYKDVVDAWAASGIIPIFANGNAGPRCGTANSPGDYDNVIGVGATTSSDTLARFSSVGPAVSGLTKPNIAAPGQNVNSAWIGTDSSYRAISGTSMACPHVAGVVALMLADKGTLTYDEIYTALTVSAATEGLTGPGKNCGGNDELTYPNNAFGYGVSHAPNAIDACDGSTYAPTPGPTPAPPKVMCDFNLLDKTCHQKGECNGMCVPDFLGVLCPGGCA